MKNNLRPINVVVTVLGVLSLGALAIWNVSCSQAPTYPVATPSQPLTRVPPVARGTTATSGATTEPRTNAAVNLTATPTPILTAEVLLARKLIQQGGQVVYSADECGKILQSESSCSVVKSATRITRPEWDKLFPQANFFLVKTDLRGHEFVQQANWLIAEQDGQPYTAETFDRLLTANGVTTITDNNRELVAKAFAIMTLANYLEEEVVFTEWKKVDAQPAKYPYDHCLRSWAKIGGQELGWCFVFGNERLNIVSGPILIRSRIGDYIEVPPEQLPSLYKDYRFPEGAP